MHVPRLAMSINLQKEKLELLLRCARPVRVVMILPTQLTDVSEYKKLAGKLSLSWKVAPVTELVDQTWLVHETTGEETLETWQEALEPGTVVVWLYPNNVKAYWETFVKSGLSGKEATERIKKVINLHKEMQEALGPSFTVLIG